MPFSESTKEEVRRKSAYTCCICQKSSTSLEAHHIIPQKDGGPDNFDNAAPLCPSCHSDFGGNPEKRKRLREMRDWLYEQVENKYAKNEFMLIKKMSDDLANIKEKLPDLKDTLRKFAESRISQITSDTASEAVSSIVGGATAYSNKLADRVHANVQCQKCGSQIGLLIGTNKCPSCSNPL